MSSTRVVITGLGAITPLGLTAEETWAGLCAGKSGIGPITAFDPVGFTCKIAGQAPGYRIQDYVPRSHRKATKLMSRDIELSVIAAREAVVDSGLVTKGIDAEKVNVDPARMAVNLGAGLISCDLVELAPAVAASVVDGRFDIRKWGKEGLEKVTPLWLLKYLPNMLPCHIGIIHDIQGPSNTLMCGESGALLAIAEAAQTIIRGAADIAVAGGAEAKVNPIVMIRQCLLGRATSKGNDEPGSACRPFDADAAGSVFGEAAGIVILEALENARRRGARIYAELVGIGQSSSINPQYEHIEPDGEGIRLAIEKAIADAQIEPSDLDLVIPHGTAIPADDLAEARAIEAALGKAAGKVSVWPTKSILSNTGAASGALDVIAAARAMSEGRIPAAKNCDRKAAGCNLNIVSRPVNKRIRYALCCTYTFGGQTAALVLKNADDEQTS
ncbi:MAG TPA: beta-ketoacyl-[acyl-carrier-protein] synthase family protein [Sedimentisphaerales bacterium]|nr:beta-ketoacyl-[acyl-carrier-protein] synthase family protein [Sedimentisphaerales bacterium]